MPVMGFTTIASLSRFKHSNVDSTAARLPVEVRAGNVFFIPPQFLFDPVNGVFPPPAPTLANPFTGFVLPGAGAGGINIIDNDLQNPMVHQMNVGVQHEFGDSQFAVSR